MKLMWIRLRARCPTQLITLIGPKKKPGAPTRLKLKLGAQLQQKTLLWPNLAPVFLPLFNNVPVFCSDCYRVERTTSRAGFPAED
jgi:hypothetical protein